MYGYKKEKIVEIGYNRTTEIGLQRKKNIAFIGSFYWSAFATYAK